MSTTLPDETDQTTEMPMSAQSHGAPAVRPGVGRRLVRDLAYALTSLPITLAAFPLAIAGLAAGLATVVVWVGLPVLVVTLLVCRPFAQLERIRLRRLQGRRSPSATYARPREGAGPVRRALTPLRDPQAWLDWLWVACSLVTAVFAFVLALTWVAAALGGLTFWFWQRWLPEEGGDVTLASLIGLGEGREAEISLNLVLGFVALITLPLVARAAAAVHAGLSDVLLNSRAELQSEVRRVVGTRDAAQRAEAESLRRLERDIHDGPQQRLVRLTMDLGRARKQLSDDPERAAVTIDDALRRARETVDELRSLSRGIAPPLLVDRGLKAALQEMVQRSELPVTVSVDLPAQLPPQVETALYFTVSEAMTNVAKHSGATRVAVAVGRRGDFVEASVTDDGHGGAHPAKGTGLAGLERRLRGVDGTLVVDSPAGGPTIVLASVPLGRA